MIKKEEKKIDKKNLYPRVVASTFIFNEKDELFLTRQLKWGKKYFPPGGGVRHLEKLKDAAIREVKEETGLKLKKIDFLGSEEYFISVSENSKNTHMVCFYYSAMINSIDAKKIILSDEADKYRWKKVSEWLADKDLHDDMKKVMKDYFVDTDSYKEKYLRALADYQNLVKRSGDERMEFVKYANEQLLHDILPVYDNLKISLEHINDEAESNGWVTGIKYVVKQFKDFLESQGVEEIKTVGKKFDHHTMEALKGEGDKVIKELKAGYKLKGKVVVPAKVELN